MSNKRSAFLSTAAFCAVVLLCLAGVGAGAWLLLFPDTPEPPPVSADTPVSGGLTDLPAAVISDATPPPEADPVESDVPGETPPQEDPPVTVEVIAPAPVTVTPVKEEKPDPVTMPLEGEVITAFSVDALTYSATLGDWRTHDGIDLAAEAGTAVAAAAAGTVADIRDDALLGTTVVLQHADGYRTTYACLEPEVSVRFGDRVTSGQLLGTVGTSAVSEAAEGPHLHFSVTRDGTPADPMEYLGK